MFYATGIIFSQEWVNISNSETTASIYDVTLNDKGIGYAVGWKSTPALLKTTDFGNTWAQLTPPDSSLLFSVATRGEDTVYIAGYSAVGSCGILYTSYNAGNTWVQTLFDGTTHPSTFGLYKYQITNDADYVCGYNGGIFKSTDKGLTWIPTNTGTTIATFRSISFYDANIGYSACDPEGGFSNINTLYSTKDGGITWSKVTSIQNSVIASVACTDAKTAFLFGYRNGTEAIQKTTDGGTTWKTVWAGSLGKTLQGGKFFPSGIGVGVGDGGMIVISTDYGKTWNISALPESLTLISCAATPDKVIVTGVNGAIWRREILSHISEGKTTSLFDFTLAPNPAETHCNISGTNPDEIKDIILCDLTGKIIYTHDYNSFGNKIELQTIPEGIYYIQVTNKNGLNSFQKLLVIH